MRDRVAQLLAYKEELEALILNLEARITALEKENTLLSLYGRRS
ncbi:hypothetical protein [Paenibacillus oenotherae]|nr:hypothetical protein [Paenibacillus oenotherae]